MASNKTIIKNGISEAVVRLVNDSATAATFTITPSELLRSSQVANGTLAVGISDITYSTSGSISISRNSTLQYYFAANAGDYTNAYGPDNTNNTSDISVTISSGTATIRLLKSSGYDNA